MKKIVIEIADDDYNRINSYPDGTTFYPITARLYKAVKDGTPLNDVFDKIKAEIREFSVVGESGTYRIMTYIVNQIIGKYKGEVDCHECKKYAESEEV